MNKEEKEEGEDKTNNNKKAIFKKKNRISNEILIKTFENAVCSLL